MVDWTSGQLQLSDGIQLYYEVAGEGAPLLFCDGLMCEGHVWKYLFSAFRPRCKLVHWHYPGHGNSGNPGPTDDVSPARMGAHLLALTGHLNLSDAVVLGHSYGVQVALEAALQAPDTVTGLLLFNGCSGRLAESAFDSDHLLRLLPLLDMGTRFVPRQMARMLHAVPVKTVFRLARFAKADINERLIDIEDLYPYFKGIYRTDLNTAIRMLEMAEEHDVTYRLRDIKSPALVFAGQRDRFVPSGQAKIMADGLSDSTYHLSRAGTHSLPLEQPDLIQLKMADFLEKVGVKLAPA